MLFRPDARLFVELNRARMIRDREIGDCLDVFGPLLKLRVNRLQFSEIVPPGFKNRRYGSIVYLGRAGKMKRITDDVGVAANAGRRILLHNRSAIF